MNKIILASVFLVLAACISPPKNRAEFRKISKDRDGVQTYTVNVPLETVVSRLNQHTEKCNSIGSKWQRNDGVTGTRVESYQGPRWENLGTDKPSLAIYQESKNTLNEPKGGVPVHMLDLQRKGPQTAVTSYSWNVNSWSMYDFTEELKHALKGEPGDCQFEKIQR